jgi:ribosome-associated translation inhibitor RaiA
MAQEIKKRGRKAKNVDVTIDTPNVDLKIEKTEEGFTADLDSKRVDIHVEKTEDRFSIEVEIDDKKEYEAIATGVNPTMPKGTIWRVTGELLKIFIRKGIANLKNKK